MAVRDWRHLYAIITGSERLGLVSFEARWLYTCLLAHQDDAGMYPWTPVRVREITATCTWSYDEATSCLAELERVGLVSRDAEMVVLRRGKELNGVPTAGSKRYRIPRYYPRSNRVSTVVEPSSNDISTALELSTNDVSTALVSSTTRREEKRREESKTGPRESSAHALDLTAYPLLTLIKDLDGFKPPAKPTEWEAKIRLSASQYHIDASELVRRFAAKWPELSLAHERKDPVAFLRNTRGTEASMLFMELRRGAGGHNGSRPTEPPVRRPPPVGTPIWVPSMGTEHRGDGSSVKACGQSGCKVPACLGARRVAEVAGGSNEPAVGHERVKAPS